MDFSKRTKSTPKQREATLWSKPIAELPASPIPNYRKHEGGAAKVSDTPADSLGAVARIWLFRLYLSPFKAWGEPGLR